MKILTDLQFEVVILIIVLSCLCIFLGHVGFGLFIIGIIIFVGIIELLRTLFVKKDKE